MKEQAESPDCVGAALRYLARPEPMDPLARIVWARPIVEQAKRDVELPRFFVQKGIVRHD